MDRRHKNRCEKSTGRERKTEVHEKRKKEGGGKNKGKLVHAMVNEQQQKSHILKQTKTNPTTKIITENEIKTKTQGETDD